MIKKPLQPPKGPKLLEASTKNNPQNFQIKQTTLGCPRWPK